MKAFDAHFVTMTEDDGIAMIGFADAEFATTQYLLIQRSLIPSQQDRELGHDRIHIEFDSQNQSGYGGVDAIRLEGTSLVVQLNDSMSKQLHTNDIVVNIVTNDIDYDLLKKVLVSVVGTDAALHF